MQNRRRFTVLSLLEPNRIGPTVIRLKPESRFLRRNAGLSDRLLANVVQWPLDSTIAFRKKLMRAPL